MLIEHLKKEAELRCKQRNELTQDEKEFLAMMALVRFARA